MEPGGAGVGVCRFWGDGDTEALSTSRHLFENRYDTDWGGDMKVVRAGHEDRMDGLHLDSLTWREVLLCSSGMLK